MFNFLKNGNDKFLDSKINTLLESIENSNSFQLLLYKKNEILIKQIESNNTTTLTSFEISHLKQLYNALSTEEEVSKLIPYEMAKRYAIKNGANHSKYKNDPEDDVLMFWRDARPIKKWQGIAHEVYDPDAPFADMDREHHIPWICGVTVMKGSNYGEKGTIIKCESKLRMTIRMNLSL
jgi:hypothetical protein